MYWLRVVLLLLISFRNDSVCPLYLVLNVLSVNPMYVSFCSLSSLVTVAWYITPDVWQFPSSGHVFPLLQLHLGWGGVCGSAFLDILLLLLEIICFMFCMQL